MELNILSDDATAQVDNLTGNESASKSWVKIPKKGHQQTLHRLAALPESIGTRTREIQTPTSDYLAPPPINSTSSDSLYNTPFPLVDDTPPPVHESEHSAFLDIPILPVDYMPPLIQESEQIGLFGNGPLEHYPNQSITTLFETFEANLNCENFGNISAKSNSLNASLDSESFSQGKICTFLGCDERRIFVQPSAFKKHMDKHIKPYKCLADNCEEKTFTNAGDLRRHHREIHDKSNFSCPVFSCKRHRKGFSRKDNLMHHLRRFHSSDSVSSSGIYPTSSGYGTQGVFLHNNSAVTDSEHNNALSGIDIIGTASERLLDKGRLKEKLQELEAMKAESLAKYDGDISALKRVLSIL